MEAMHIRFPQKFAAITQDEAILRKPSLEIDITKPDELEMCRVLAEEMTDLLLIGKHITKDPVMQEATSIINEALDLEYDGTNIIGYGMAARQLKSQEKVEAPRLSVVVLPRAVKDGRTIQHGQLLWMVNPQILRSAMMKRYKGEGCLSKPGVYHNTDRHMIVTVGFLDLKKLLVDPDPLKAAREIELSGIEAVVMQHEIDHHDGRLFTDLARVPTVRQDKVGANDKCPCGSGLKYKKCCQGKVESAGR